MLRQIIINHYCDYDFWIQKLSKYHTQKIHLTTRFYRAKVTNMQKRKEREKKENRQLLVKVDKIIVTRRGDRQPSNEPRSFPALF